MFIAANVAGLSAFAAGEPEEFSLPTVAATATADGTQSAPLELGTGPTSSSLENGGAAFDQMISPSAERWARRSLKLREAARHQAEMGGDAQTADRLSFNLQQPVAPAPVGSVPGGAAAPYVPQAPGPQSPGLQPGIQPQMPGMPGITGQINGRFNQPGALDAAAAPMKEPITNPSQLPKLTQIMPWRDYEPDPKIAREDPCQNLCPRPDGLPCKPVNGRIPECPKEITLSSGPFQPRTYAPSVYTWQASNLCYNPLYFEDPALERYGHTWPCYLQPLVSVGRFTLQAAGMPYQMTIDPPCCGVTPLGYFRPGECAPKLIYQIPWNTEAAVVEAGAVTGVYFLFPHSAWR